MLMQKAIIQDGKLINTIDVGLSYNFAGMNDFRTLGIGLGSRFDALFGVGNKTPKNYIDCSFLFFLSLGRNIPCYLGSTSMAKQRIIRKTSSASNTIHNKINNNIEVTLEAEGRVLAKTIAPYTNEFDKYEIGRQERYEEWRDYI